LAESSEELLDVFASLYRLACGERDAAAAFALWATDEDVALYDSEQSDTAVGPAAVATHLAAIAASKSDISFAWDELRVHTEGDAAWVNASGSLTVDRRRSAYQTTGVFVRRDGRWRWHTHSGSEPH
jgi:ketosteroid isomerase-like protein